MLLVVLSAFQEKEHVLTVPGTVSYFLECHHVIETLEEVWNAVPVFSIPRAWYLESVQLPRAHRSC